MATREVQGELLSASRFCDGVPDPCVIVDGAGHVLHANPRYVAWLAAPGRLVLGAFLVDQVEVEQGQQRLRWSQLLQRPVVGLDLLTRCVPCGDHAHARGDFMRLWLTALSEDGALWAVVFKPSGVTVERGILEEELRLQGQRLAELRTALHEAEAALSQYRKGLVL